jgi:ABC-type glycerol-3-phosphate transport system substrate-binding protein
MVTLSRRSVLKVAAGASVAGLLAACGATATPAAVQTEATTAPTAAAPAATTAPAQTGGKGGELRFIKLAMDKDVEPYFNDTVIPGFQDANPGYTVKVDMSDWGHLGEKLMTSFAGGLAVDMVETGSDWVGPYAARQQFAPLDDIVASDYQSEIGDFYPDMVDISRYSEKLMAMPYTIDIRTMCYRKDQFEEAGLDPASAPDTWDDMVAYAGKLVQTDSSGNITRAGYAMSAATPTDAFFEYWYALVQNSTDVVVPWGSWKSDDVKLETPEAKEALQFLIDLINKYKVSPLTGMSTKNPDLSVLSEGIASMHTEGSSIVSNFRRYAPDLIETLGVGKPVQHTARKHYCCPNVYAIGTNTKDFAGAWSLMSYMISKDIMTGMLSPTQTTPPRKSIAADAEYMQDPMLKAFQAVPEQGWGTTTPQATEWPTLENIGNYVQAAIRNEMTVDEALAKAAEDTKRKIDELVTAVGA